MTEFLDVVLSFMVCTTPSTVFTVCCVVVTVVVVTRLLVVVVTTSTGSEFASAFYERVTLLYTSQITNERFYTMLVGDI